MKKIFNFPVFIVVLIIAAIFLIAANKNKGEDSDSKDITQECVNHTGLGMHIHPRLAIIINGENQIIPAGIGIPDLNCMRPVHIHDESGTIHIEYKRKRDFNLAEFFRIWGKDFNREQIFDYRTDEKHFLKMTVNGQENHDFENLILRDLDTIKIEYGEIK